MTAETPAIEIRDLVRTYGRTDAVDGLNLHVQPGRCYGFFGRNGAGKDDDDQVSAEPDPPDQR